MLINNQAGKKSFWHLKQVTLGECKTKRGSKITGFPTSSFLVLI